MTKKEKTIRAINDLIRECRKCAAENKKKIISTKSCPLCAIHWESYDCTGCPMADYSGSDSCMNFNSSKALLKVTNENMRKANTDRADFHEFYLLPIVEAADPKLFTKSGWEFWNLDYTK